MTPLHHSGASRTKVLALLIAFIALLTGNLLAVDIKIQADRWMPINGRSDEKPPGYAVELLVEAFTDSDNVVYTLEPWKLALENTQAGVSDAAIGAAADEAEGLILPKEPIGHLTYGLFHLKEKNYANYTAETLKNAKIGVIEGYTYWPELDALIKAKSPNLVVFSGEEPLTEAVEALQNGKIDLLPEAMVVLNWHLRDKNIAPEAVRPCFTFDSGNIYVVFHSSDTGRYLAEKWDRRIAELRKSGKLAEILAKYHTQDWVTK